MENQMALFEKVKNSSDKTFIKIRARIPLLL